MKAIHDNAKDYFTFTLWLLAGAAALTATITNIVVILVFLVCIIFYRLKFLADGAAQDWLLRILVIYVAIIVLNLVREPALRDITNIFLEKRILLFIPFLFYVASLSDQQKLRFAKIFTISVTIAVIISVGLTLAKFGYEAGLYEFSWHLSISTIFPSNYLALFAGFCLIMLFYSFFNESLFSKQISFSLFCFLTAFLAVLGSRLPFFSALIIILAYSSSRFKSKRNLIIFLILSCAGIILLVSVVPYFKSRIIVLYTVGPIADARYYEYQAAWNALKENFILGFGFTGAENAMVEEMERIGFHEGVENRYNSHNQFLQSILVAGIPGLLTTLALYIGCMVRAIQTRKFIAIAFVSYFTLCSLTECLLERNKGILFFGIFAGLLLVRGRKSLENAHSPSRMVS